MATDSVARALALASLNSGGGSGGSDKVFIATYGTSTSAQVASAISAGKIVACYYEYTTNDKHWLYLVDETDSKYVFAEASVATDGNMTAIGGLGAALNKTTSAWEVNTGGASIPTFPATIVNDRYLHTNATTGELEWSEAGGGSSNAVLYTQQTLTDAQKTQALKNLDGIRVIKLTDANETLAELTTRISTINANEEHVFFDVATLSYPLYLCTISIIYNGSIPTVYRLNDLVSGSVSLGAYDGTKTLGTILSEAVEDYVNIIVTCTTNDGVTVTGQTVTLRNGSDSSAPVVETKAYDGQPVSFIVAKNFNYFVQVSDTLAGHFAPTTATGIASTNTNVTLTYQDVSSITNYEGVKAALTSLADPTVMIGLVEIADTWTDENGTEYSDPACVMAIQTVEDEDGETHTAAIMQRKYAIKNSMQFDAPEKEIATGTYQSGLYYYKNESGTITLLVEGTDYQVGDTIEGTVYVNSIRDTSKNIVNNGYNNYKMSAIRQYLNSEAALGAWWTAQHTGDSAPSQATTVRGYLAGCSTALKNAAKAIKIQCNTNTVTDTGRIDVMYDKIWLPSGTEMFGSANSDEGVYFPLVKTRMGESAPTNSANAGRIYYNITNHSSASFCRLRSAYRSHSYDVWTVTTSGTLYYYNAYTSPSCAPAFAIY